MKKTLSLAVVLCLLVSLFSGLTISVSAADAVEVGTAAELIAAIAANPAGSFKLTADITGITAPLTNASTPFTGTLDGDGHSIDVNISATDANGTGLFCVTNGATIKNLTLTGTVANNSFNYVAGFVGIATGGSFSKLTNNATMTIAGNVNHIAGIVSMLNMSAATGSVEFSACVNNADIKSVLTASGGILGELQNVSLSGVNVTFRNCVNNGEINGGYGNNVGGIAGLMNNANIPQVFINCYNTGVVYNGGWVAGIAVARRASFTNCYNTGAITATHGSRPAAAFVVAPASSTTPSLTNCYNIGIINNAMTGTQDASLLVGVASGGTITPTYENCYYKAAADGAAANGVTPTATITAAKLNGAEGTAWKDSTEYDHPLLVSNPEPETTVEPDPDPEEPTTIEIATAADLAKVAANPDGDFVQTADIEGVTDVILTTATPFTGTYDGGNFSIDVNLTLAADKTGLFSMTDGATIKNLTVTGSVTNPGIEKSGIFVGTVTNSTFEKLTSNVNLTIDYTSSVNYLGGIAGFVAASTNETTSFTNCVNYTNMRNSNKTGKHIGSTGGILGGISNSTTKGTLTFTSCANHAKIYGMSGQNIGGIFGNAEGANLWVDLVFTDCYNTGDIGGQYPAAITAMNARGKTTTLTNCYNLGTVETTRADRPGAILVYGGRPGTINLVNCYNTGAYIDPTGVYTCVRLFYSTAATVSYTNCYALAHNETAATGITVVNAAGLKAANTALGSAYEIGTAYPYPQLKSNPQTLAWGFHLLTVSAGANGSVSYTGTKYVKAGTFALTVTPDEGYIIDEITGQAGYDTLGDTVALTLADAGETTIAVTFAVRPNVAPVVAKTSTFTFDGANYIFVQLNKGYGYEDADMTYGIGWANAEDADLTNLPGSGIDANGFFGVKLDGFKNNIYIKGYAAPAVEGAFDTSYGDVCTIVPAE